MLRLGCLLAGLILASGASFSQGASGVPLVQADQPVSVGLGMSDGAWRVMIHTGHPATVTVRCPVKPGIIKVEGLREPVQLAFDQRSLTLTLTLTAGHYAFVLRP
jgi:hypothetical protein